MVQFGKPDCPVWRLLRVGPVFCPGLHLLALGLILLYGSLLWTLLPIALCFISGRSLAPQPCLTLAAP
jgi:hypothetical protein